MWTPTSANARQTRSEHAYVRLLHVVKKRHVTHMRNGRSVGGGIGGDRARCPLSSLADLGLETAPPTDSTNRLLISATRKVTGSPSPADTHSAHPCRVSCVPAFENAKTDFTAWVRTEEKLRSGYCSRKRRTNVMALTTTSSEEEENDTSPLQVLGHVV